jgi:hypothetical protein
MVFAGVGRDAGFVADKIAARTQRSTRVPAAA